MASSTREEIDTYLEKLLCLQYEASDFIKHKLTKGELREKFLINVVKDEFPNILLGNGILTKGKWQSSQGDFLHLNQNGRIGSLNSYDVIDCKMFMEIKSKATKGEFDLLEQHALEIKDKNSNIKVGMFCYSTSAKEITVLKNQGFKYDKTILAYDMYNRKQDRWPDIDFLYCLNYRKDVDSSSYFVYRENTGNKLLFKDSPVINYFMNMLREI